MVWPDTGALLLLGRLLFLNFAFRREGNELQDGAVDAIALVGRGLVTFSGEDVTQVTVANGTANFGSRIAEVMVRGGFDILRLGGVVEGWPAAMGIELLLGTEEFGTASGAIVGAAALVLELVVDLSVGSFRACFAENLVLLRGEDLAPFFVGLFDRRSGLSGSFLKRFDDRLHGIGSGEKEGQSQQEKGSGPG